MADLFNHSITSFKIGKEFMLKFYIIFSMKEKTITHFENHSKETSKVKFIVLN